MENFQIIVPVFNEEKTLRQVLSYAKDHDYLKHIVFVNDASTDSSSQILHEWAIKHGVRAITLNNNCKKEGAIRVALDVLEKECNLAPYTILLDSDSFIAGLEFGETLNNQMNKAISHMKLRGLTGMGFQIDAISNTDRNIFSYGAFADYSAMQFDQWLMGKQQQLWVINGPGGIFETKYLLDILRSIVPDFETGDLLITVELMKDGRLVEFYRDITIKTLIPTSLRMYFNQRRRWERGTTKVLWNERKFYAALFSRPSLLAAYTLIHLSLYIGLVASILMILISGSTGKNFIYIIAETMVVWLVISIFKGLWLKATRPKFPLLRYCFCAMGNGLLWILVTTPARLTGFVEAVAQLTTNSHRSLITCPDCSDGFSWLPNDQNAYLSLNND